MVIHLLKREGNAAAHDGAGIATSQAIVGAAVWDPIVDAGPKRAAFLAGKPAAAAAAPPTVRHR